AAARNRGGASGATVSSNVISMPGIWPGHNSRKVTMKRILARLANACRYAGVLVFAAMLGNGHPAEAATVSAAAKAAAFGPLIQKASERGLVRAIVRLDVPTSPVGTLPSLAAVGAQRAAIADAQDRIERALGSGQLKVKRRYAHIPFMAMNLDATT